MSLTGTLNSLPSVVIENNITLTNPQEMLMCLTNLL